jgi:hypothetical protein
MRSIIQWSALLGAGIVAAACGSNSSGNFGNQPGGGGDDGGDTSSSSSGSGATGSGSGGGSSSSAFGISSGGGMGNGTCKTGEYAGTFTCEFFLGDGGVDAAADSGLLSISGTLSFALTQNQTAGVGEGTGTDVAMGTFAANTGGFIAATADLNGTLNCAQGIFTGSLTNGDYGLATSSSGMPLSGPGNTFMGPFNSDYDGTTAAFVMGTWSMAIAGEGTCAGSWTAAYTGPLTGGISDAGGQ